MKKILLAIAFIMTMGAGAMAQDDFFRSWDNVYDNRLGDGDPDIVIPNNGESGNSAAPLGSGLLVLTALGAGYAVICRKNK